jgi:Domain of unknown function (DUF4386)
MSATANVELHERSPRVTARLAGIFYLLNIATIFLAIFFFRGLFVSGDIAATATNLAAHSTLFGLGFASEIISTACSVCVAAFLYELFKPVDGTVSLLAAFFRLLGCAVAAMGYVFQVAPFQIGKHGPGFAALKVDAVQAVSSLVSTLHVHTSNILLLFFWVPFHSARLSHSEVARSTARACPTCHSGGSWSSRFFSAANRSISLPLRCWLGAYGRVVSHCVATTWIGKDDLTATR